MKKFMLLVLTGSIAGFAGCATTPTRSTQYPASNNFSQPAYAQPNSQDEYNKKIIKQGLLGAGVGAISAEASGGKAGTGALVGAGTNVLGGALLDMLTAPSQQVQPQYTPYVEQWNQQNPGNARIVRKFDSNGNVISEEVFKR